MGRRKEEEGVFIDYFVRIAGKSTLLGEKRQARIGISHLGGFYFFCGFARAGGGSRGFLSTIRFREVKVKVVFGRCR